MFLQTTLWDSPTNDRGLMIAVMAVTLTPSPRSVILILSVLRLTVTMTAIRSEAVDLIVMKVWFVK